MRPYQSTPAFPPASGVRHGSSCSRGSLKTTLAASRMDFLPFFFSRFGTTAGAAAAEGPAGTGWVTLSSTHAEARGGSKGRVGGGRKSEEGLAQLAWKRFPGKFSLEMDNYKAKVISGLLPTALLGSRCRYRNRSELQQIKPNRTAQTN